MGGGGGQENGGGDQGTDFLAVQHSVNDLVGAPVAALTEKGIDSHAQQAAHRQQENKPIMFSPQMGDEMEGVVERSA